MILEKLIHFISYIKQECLYNSNIFSNKHLEIYPNRVYNPTYLIENKIYRKENAMGECCNNIEDISLSCHCGANDSLKSSSSQP